MNGDDRTALAGLATEERLRAGDLIAELNSRARRIGLNTTDWPGLTMYRFEAPVVPSGARFTPCRCAWSPRDAKQ